MKTSVVYSLRSIALAVTLTFATTSAFAKHTQPPDRAAELLARFGTISVDAAGPYVEIGTFRIQVMAKLGSPSAKLPDGTWLYRSFDAEDSEAHGILVVRFVNGRVSSLSLVATAVATEMMAPTAAAAKRGSN
jgi:hypothetical protein